MATVEEATTISPSIWLRNAQKYHFDIFLITENLIMHENIGYSIYLGRETFRGTTTRFSTSLVLLQIVGQTKNACLTMYVQEETLLNDCHTINHSSYSNKRKWWNFVNSVSIRRRTERQTECSHNVIGLHQTSELETHKDNNANLKTFPNTTPSTSVDSSSPNVWSSTNFEFPRV